MKSRFLPALLMLFCTFCFWGCETGPERVNLVDGKPVPKESIFQFRAEREELEPHEQRRSDLEWMSRRR